MDEGMDLKLCRLCKKSFPPTRDYFPIRASSGRLRSECRTCHNKAASELARSKNARQRGEMEVAVEPESESRQGEITLRELATQLGISREKVLNDIHKGRLLPVKAFGASGPLGFKYLICPEEATKYADYCLNGNGFPHATDRCGCCGTTKGNILGDINEVEQIAYGYLCSSCYRLIREFHADAERMQSAYTYLLRTRRPAKKKHSS